MPAELRQRYAGTYTYDGGNSERSAVAAAVDRAVEPMSFFARDFARNALMKRAEIRESFAIFFDDAGNVGVLSPGELPEVSPADGTPVRVRNRFGDESELTQQFENGVLIQRGRRWEYRVRAAAGRTNPARPPDHGKLSASASGQVHADLPA